MSAHLAGRVVLVTGAASGFGRLIAEKCAAGGAKVVGVDVNAAALTEVVDGIVAAGGEALAQVADVTDLTALQTAVRHAVTTLGAVDVLVNNAGMMPLAYFADHERAWQRWHQAIDINIKGVVNGICAVYDQMIAQGRGHVVNISSTYSNAPTEGAGVYAATKCAVNMISESLRIEGQGRIKVSIVRPTGVPTTALAGSIVNRRASIGMVGHHAAEAGEKMKQLFTGTLPPQFADLDAIGCFALDPATVAETILYVIDQPWGVSISDITVRASGEPYLL